MELPTELVLADALSAIGQTAKGLVELLSPAKQVESWRMGLIRVARAKLRLEEERRKAAIQLTLINLDEEVARSRKLLELARLRKEITLQRAETLILLGAIAEAVPAEHCALLEELAGDCRSAALREPFEKVVRALPRTDEDEVFENPSPS
jgi:hypothetical protein